MPVLLSFKECVCIFKLVEVMIVLPLLLLFPIDTFPYDILKSYGASPVSPIVFISVFHIGSFMVGLSQCVAETATLLIKLTL